MKNKCPICEKGILREIEQNKKGKHYFLCTIDTSVEPANIDGSGMPVDAYGCTNCGTIILNSKSIINK